MAGKFVIKKGRSGQFRFSLVGRNGQIVATSETYTTKAACLNGIKAVKTLAEVFPGLDLYPSGQGEVIAVGTLAPVPPETLAARAMALQERYNFRFPLMPQLQRRMAKPQSEAEGGDLLTDDFAPVNLYDTIGRQPRRRR